MSASPPGVWLVMCHFDPDARERMLELRAAHLEFAIGERDRIRYGGLLSGPSGPTGIAYFVEAADRTEVEAWTRRDPYGSVYASVEVTPFVQRIPEGGPRELERLLDAAREQR